MWDEDDRTVKERSLDNEERLAGEIGFTCTPGSGNQPWPGSKGDGLHPVFMFECKETQRKSIRVAAADVGKLVREAAVIGKEPALVMSAYGLEAPIPQDWVAVPAEVFRWLLSQLDS